MTANRWMVAGLVCGALAVGTLGGAGCPPPGPGDDAGVPDVCNSLDEALNDPQCTIPQGDPGRLDWISVPLDKDWFSFVTPSTMGARSLLRVTSGYGASATPVQLALNALVNAPDAGPDTFGYSLGRVADLHGQGAPQPLELLTRFTQPSQRVVLLMQDQPDNPTRPQADPRNQYLVKWDVLLDPDVNEPNDTTPTPIPLSGTTSLTGTGTGVLATPDDQDLFSFNAPAAGKVLYFHIGEATLAPKPVKYRLAWTLLDPAGVQIGEGRMRNDTLDIDLATARLIQLQGTYTLSIHAYREPGVLGPLPGDERLTYKIDVLIVDQLDTNEPNDTLVQSQPRAVSLALGSTRTFTGRIGYVGDPDWYAVDVPADAQPRVLHYKVLPPSGTGRFPPLPLGASGLPDREVTVVTEVTAGTSACKTNPAACPKGYFANPGYQLPVEQVCARTPAQCLWSDREEDYLFPNLKNFEGRLPVAPHGTPIRYYLLVQDVGNDWADDLNYSLQVTLEADPDEEGRVGLPGQTVVTSLAQDTSGSTFPVPPAGATTLSGTLSHGYGRTVLHVPTQGQGIRGPGDYDAVPSDVDRYELDLPFIDPAQGPLDRMWELQWSVQSVSGAVPLSLALEVELCDGTAPNPDGGSCNSVTTTRSGGALVLAYDPQPLHSWWNDGTYAYQPLYTLDAGAPGNLYTARGYGCFCFEPRFIQGGKLFVKVTAVDRDTWDVAPYTVRTAFTSYPKSFAVFSDGGTITCPAVNDAGTPADGGTDGGTDGGADAGPPPPRGGCDFTR